MSMPSTSPAQTDIKSAKAALRRTALQVRRQVAPEARGAAAAAVAGRVGELFARHPQALNVSGFLPIGDELDPRPALEAARVAGHRICLPVMVDRNQPLLFRAWRPGDPMVERQWGISEPADTADVLEPDVLLMPLLAFDETGGRLGYGGGYYDRSLARLRGIKTVLAVGLAHDVQRVDSVPCLDYDERLDWVLTPARAIVCRASPQTPG